MIYVYNEIIDKPCYLDYNQYFVNISRSTIPLAMTNNRHIMRGISKFTPARGARWAERK